MRRAGTGIGTDPGQHAPVIGHCGSDDDASGGERVEQEFATSYKGRRAGRSGFAGELGR